MIGIPKKIIQVWVGDDANIPEYYQASLDSIQRHMVARGWEYKLLKEPEITEFIAREYPDFLDTYKNYPYDIQRADAIRPLWLKRYGGLYLDMDFEVLAPLEELFASNSDAYFLPSPDRDIFHTALTNAIMASKPGVSVWDRYIERLKIPTKPWIVGKHLEVMNSTGPVALSKALAKSSGVYSTLPTTLLAPCSICNVDSCNKHTTNPNQLMRQLSGMSWHSIDSTAYNFLFCYRKYLYFIAAAVALAVVVVLVLRRKKNK